ncbi:T9SS type B sorting domain-containing protein [Winogradskyella psychrotolerans]|uniref:T9SS type B sorting domain-containing protein n=1 Tax=Winogradskyella psychrotolerans TaxID=1344585 RepID=UPI001C0738C4|nr:T9SS type B sorting domain-containing protein [Winogradskyella psychrotolerans]MBU2920917.1 T9SS type B sorting domain-containing protein [Winogradskyella psychrotolerans]
MTRINLLIHYTYVLSLFFITNAYAIMGSDAITDNNFCPAPIINTFTPSSGPENTLITISGSNFNATASVSIDGVNTTFTIINDNQITAIIPAGISDTSSFSIVSNGGCTGTSAADFTLITSDCEPADIYISEIFDANSGDYAVIELYNPTNAPVVLDNIYVIERYGDVGNPTPNNVFNNITGTIPPLDTFIIQMGSGNDCSPLDVDFNIPTGINDNDEFKLFKNGNLIDIVNAPDERGYTVVRNADAPLPQTTYDSSDWSIQSSENCSDLGSHTADPITNNIPNIIDPITQTICENGSVTFTTSLNNSIFQYQWKVLDSSGNWINVPNASPYSDPQNSWLDITNAPLSFNGNQYYCEVTYNSCLLITNAALLIIDSPAVDTLSNQTTCSNYTLPTLTNGNYFTGTNGTGTQLNAGDVISTNQTIYIYNEIGTAPNTCSNESSFEVTITGAPDIDTIANQDLCSGYTLPTLTNGNYFTGSNGTGTPLNAGDVISTSQTIYIYNEIGIAPNTCSNESSFEVTITGAPDIDTITNQDVCSGYTLPTLTNGNYFTSSNGTGTPLNAGDIISTSQTIYIYNEIGIAPNTCSNESSFDVTVSGTPDIDTLSNQSECGSFTLPTLTNGNYYTEPNGTGTPLNAGDTISTSQTIYIYVEIGTAPDTCNNESSFDITITGAPNVDTLANQTICSEFILPALSNGNYFTGTNGTGTQRNAGDIITNSQTLYIYNDIGTAPNTCSNESSFDITINDAVDFTLDEFNIFINEGTLTVNMTDTSLDYEYAIDGNDFQISNIFNNLTTGLHLLYVQDRSGCVLKTLSFEIEEDLFIPVFFTPNNDTTNDFWTVIDRNSIVKEILIFNRYGKLIKQLIPSQYSWDGYYNGELLESNDFWYLITLKNGKELRGHFALKH